MFQYIFFLSRHKREGCIVSVRLTKFHFSLVSVSLGFGCFHISLCDSEANKGCKLHMEGVIKNKRDVCRE